MPFQNTLPASFGRFGRAETIECGLVIVKESKAIALPLTAVTAHVDIINVVSEVTLTQTYVNTSDDVIQAVYFFPVEDNAALHFFEANKDGVVLKGEIREKGRARTEFQEAIAANKTAFLLEEHKPDVLELYVGNLAAGSTCTITLKYLTELSTDLEEHRFTLPTTIAPRYIPSSDANSIFHEANYQSILDAPIEITINCQMRSTIKSVTSPSHKIVNTFETRDHGLRYTSHTALHGTVAVMDKDFVAVIVCDDPLKPIVVCGRSDEYDAYALMVSMVPNFETDEEMCEMIFLVDCSGSMGGQKIQQAKGALIIFLQSLPTDCYFNIICFGSRFTGFKETSVKYSDTTLREAKAYVMDIYASLGGTEILRPVQHILETPEIEGYIKQVFVLTDGQVSNEDQVMAYIKEHRKRSRFFSLGLGEAASRSLVKGIARSGDGVALFCTTNEIMHSKVVGLLQSSLQIQFSITNIRFERKLGTDQYCAIEDQPDTTQDQPNTTQDQPDATQDQPDTTQAQPDTTQDQPDTTQDQPDTTQDQPDTTQDQPDTTQDQPDTTQDQPDTTQDQPDTTQDQPDTTQDQPDTTQDQPDTTQDQPDTTQALACEKSPSDRYLTEAPHLPLYLVGKSRSVYFKLISDIPDRVVLTAQSCKKTVDIVLDEVIALDSYVIHKLGARKIIQSFTESTTLAPSDSTLCSLALKYGVLSKYTSFISIEDHIETIEANNLGKHARSYIATIGVDFGVDFGQERFRSISRSVGSAQRQQNQRFDVTAGIPTIGYSRQEDYDRLSSLSLGASQFSKSASRTSSFAGLVSGLLSGWSNPFKSQASPPVSDSVSGSASSQVNDSSEKIVKILDLADMEGHFTVGSDVDLEALIGISLEKIEKESGEESWITLVIISVLEHTYSDIRGTWAMVVDKSIKWAKNCLGEEYGKRKEDAEKFVKDNLKI